MLGDQQAEEEETVEREAGPGEGRETSGLHRLDVPARPGAGAHLQVPLLQGRWTWLD